MTVFCFSPKSKRAKIRVLLVSLLLILSAHFVFASPAKDVYQYNLDNGLTLFVAENHNVPLVYIEIAVRAGAVTQTAETAGLFHLYEHMMFKGNALYPNAASFDRASQDMGVAHRNGSTGIDCVNYFFTVPTNELENGLAFWNAAVRSPLMREDEFENEKRVVLAEIEGRKANPGNIYGYYRDAVMFPDEPYRLDPGGSFDSISNATIEQLRQMQATYYIPSNTALFVGGDVNPKEVFELVKKIYGNWSDGGMPVPKKGAKPANDPLAKIATAGGNSGTKPRAKFAVMPFDQMSPDLAQVAIDFRGPDSDFDLEDTYVADYLLHIFDEPDGFFKKSLVNNDVLGIPDVDYAWSSYATARASGILNFGSMILSPGDNLVGRVNLFLSEITDKIIPQIADDKSLYQLKKRNEIARKLNDVGVWQAQTAAGLLNDLRFWWTVASDDYYYSYSKNISKVRQNDAKKFVEKYIEGKTPLVSVLVNPAVYESIKDELENAGYEVITSEKAYWFNDARFAGESASDGTSASGSASTDASSSVSAGVSDGGGRPAVDNSDIYKPAPRSSVATVRDGASANPVIEKKLANGIPVYVEQVKNSKVSSIYVAVRGGIQNLTPETSGLENALFSMMSRASENYDYTTRQKLEHEKNFSIGTMSRVAGSAISLNAIDSYLYELLPVFVDGIINPSYDESVYDLLMTDYYQGIQSMMNNPQSLLSYEISKTLYTNHPYETRSQVMPDSIAQITIENMKSLHEKILAPENMIVVAVGNIDANKLVRQLNKSLGKIAPKGVPVLYSLDVPEVEVSGEPVVLTHPSVAGTGHVERVFKSPVPTSDDFVPAVLAADIYSNVLYHVVREHYGACYTPQSFVSESKAPTGEEYLYRVSNLTDFASYMKEARDMFAAGNTIDSLDDDGNYVYAPLAERLDSYKNTYINETYAAEQTVSSKASGRTYNLLQYNDWDLDEKRLQKIYDTTAEDVLRVFKKYWVEGSARWFAIVGPENEGLTINN